MEAQWHISHALAKAMPDSNPFFRQSLQILPPEHLGSTSRPIESGQGCLPPAISPPLTSRAPLSRSGQPPRRPAMPMVKQRAKRKIRRKDFAVPLPLPPKHSLKHERFVDSGPSILCSLRQRHDHHTRVFRVDACGETLSSRNKQLGPAVRQPP